MTSKMSAGISPYDFVQQVYYLQEKTLLDFWPNDDKYREVLTEANLVLQELESQEDWTWLREKLVLGSCDGITKEIVSFTLPQDVHKLSTLYHDALRLYFVRGMDDEDNYILDERHFIPVPIASAGDQRFNREYQVQSLGINHVHDYQLRAVVQGDTVMFNRLLTPMEARMVLVADVQKHIKPFHVCNMHCTAEAHGSPETTDVEYGPDGSWPHPCTLIDDVYLEEVPNPNYVVTATAARHAEGSPPALARVATLQDSAQRILSQMRQDDCAATDSDWIEWDVPGYIEVI